MGKGCKTEFEGFDNLLGRFANESAFLFRLFSSVLYFKVHLPAYIIR